MGGVGQVWAPGVEQEGVAVPRSLAPRPSSHRLSPMPPVRCRERPRRSMSLPSNEAPRYQTDGCCAGDSQSGAEAPPH